jgi:hypothetical protein
MSGAAASGRCDQSIFEFAKQSSPPSEGGVPRLCEAGWSISREAETSLVYPTASFHSPTKGRTDFSQKPFSIFKHRPVLKSEHSNAEVPKEQTSFVIILRSPLIEMNFAVELDAKFFG